MENVFSRDMIPENLGRLASVYFVPVLLSNTVLRY